MTAGLWNIIEPLLMKVLPVVRLIRAEYSERDKR